MSGARTGGYVALEPGLYLVAFAGMMSGAYRVDFYRYIYRGRSLRLWRSGPGVYTGEKLAHG